MNIGPIAYLATPYAHEKKSIMQLRYEWVTKVAGQLMKAGTIVYSPITHCHPIACNTDLPRGWDFWEKYDLAFLGRSSHMFVLDLKGWEESKGLAAELDYCKVYRIPVVHLDPKDFGIVEIYPT